MALQITFGDTNLFTELCMYCTDYSISAPVPKTHYISIPGRSGDFDITDTLGTLRYEDRNISFVFYRYCRHENLPAFQTSLYKVVNGTKYNIYFSDCTG